MIEHSAGQWELFSLEPEGHFVKWWTIGTPDVGIGLAYTLADALHFAAIPEMTAALKQVGQDKESDLDYNEGVVIISMATMRAIQAAIAKAEGRNALH